MPRCHFDRTHMRKRNFVARTTLSRRPVLVHPRADHTLGKPVLPVDVRRVDEVDPRVQRAVHDRERGFLVAADLVHHRFLVGLAERHGTKTQHRDFEPTIPQASIFHPAILLGRHA